ncbi:MAG: ATP-binding protein [Planctomycetota bacterium]
MPQHRREISIALVGLLSAAALIAFAFLAVPNASEGGELALVRIGSRAADEVIAAWDRLLRGKTLPVSGHSLRWRGDDKPPPRPQPRPIEVPDPTETAFGALLAAAETAELREADLPKAAELLVDALKQAPDDAGKALVRSRLLQLLVHAGRTDMALEQWRALTSSLSGDETTGGISLLLRAGLAVAPTLDDPEQQEVGRLLAERWLAGELAVPDAEITLARRPDAPTFAVSPSWQLLFDRVLAIAPAEHRAPLRDRLAQLERLTILDRLESLPSISTQHWRLVPFSGDLAGVWLAARQSGDGEAEARLFYESVLLEALRRSTSLPPDVVLELNGDRDEGDRIRRPERLPGTDIVFAIRHLDPSSPLRGEARRLLLLRGGFVALGVLLALATLLAVRSLRRERKLQALRTAFVASASHELRTPVASLILLSENLRSKRVSDPNSVERYVGWIHQEAGRLRRLVDDLLDFSRLERGRTPELRFETVDVEAFGSALGRDLREAAERRGALCTIQVHCTSARMRVDADALRRAVWNLVDNALAHGASDEPVALEIHCQNEQMKVTVQDQGPGIEARNREAIFSPFWTAGSTGTGLGLAISREIARAHGGDLVLEESSRGARFVLSVPVTAQGKPTREGATVE